MARTPSVYLRVKVDQQMKDAIDSVVSDGTYHDVHEFARKAFKTQLDPRRDIDRTRVILKELIQTDPEIRDLFMSGTPPKSKKTTNFDQDRGLRAFNTFIDFSGYSEKTISKGLGELESIEDPDAKLLFLMFEHSLLYGFITKLKQMQPDEKNDPKKLLIAATDFAGRDRALLSMFNKEPGKITLI